MVGDAQAAAGRAGGRVAQSRLAAGAARSGPRVYDEAGTRDRSGGAQARFRLPVFVRQAVAALSIYRTDREGSEQRSTRGDHRPRTGKTSETVFHPANRQRGPGPRTRHDAPSAIGGDVFGLGRARVTDYGLVDPDPSAWPLGARAAGADARVCDPQDYLRAGLFLGFARARDDPRGQLRRLRDLRSRNDLADDANARIRFASR